MVKKAFRIIDAVTIMETKGRLRFFTLTVKEHGLPLREVANRWRLFSRLKWWRKLVSHGDYLMVYEPHPSGHGWHIHCITNFFIPWQQLQLAANSVHFGHTDIAAADSNTSLYVCKYITKSQIIRSKEGLSRSVRIVNMSRGLTRLSDVLVSSPSINYIRQNWNNFWTFSPWSRSRHLYWCWLAETTGVVFDKISAHLLKHGNFGNGKPCFHVETKFLQKKS